MTRLKNNLQAGFTIIELMIATMVFAVILLVITYGVLHFTNSYYKGINSSTTQNTARSAIDTISQAIQFGNNVSASSGSPSGQFCAGGKIFLYTTGALFTGTSKPTGAPWGLYERDDKSSNCDASLATGGLELLGSKMRIASFSVASVGPNLWQISLKIAYGDNDLLCAPISQPGSCSSGGALSDMELSVGDITCKSQIGSQFCSVSALSTTVEQRIGNN